MALDSANDLSAFHEFVATQLQTSGDLRTPEECLEMWRVLHPQSQDLIASATAVKDALVDMANGDAGQSARELLNLTRAKYDLGS